MRCISTPCRRRICRCPAPCRACCCGIPIPKCIWRSKPPAGRSALTAERSTPLNRRCAPDSTGSRRPRPIIAGGFLFHDAGTQGGVDAAFDGGALVILEVDRARQSDEFGVEGLRAFLVANV